MGLLESSYEASEAGALPAADWLRKPSSRHRWPTVRPRCRSRSLQRRRVVSMFWGPRPPEPAGRSRSVEGGGPPEAAGTPSPGRQLPQPWGGAGPVDPADPARPALSAPVTPTVAGGGDGGGDSSDGSPDTQYRQALRQLAGDIGSLLRSAADDEEGVLDDCAPAAEVESAGRRPSPPAGRSAGRVETEDASGASAAENGVKGGRDARAAPATHLDLAARQDRSVWECRRAGDDDPPPAAGDDGLFGGECDADVLLMLMDSQREAAPVLLLDRSLTAETADESSRGGGGGAGVAVLALPPDRDQTLERGGDAPADVRSSGSTPESDLPPDSAAVPEEQAPGGADGPSDPSDPPPVAAGDADDDSGGGGGDGAVWFPRASDVDSAGPLCLLADHADLWETADDGCQTVRFVPGQNGIVDCSYTCHQRCRDLVTLDCPSDASSDLDLSEVTDPNQDEDLVEVQTLVKCDNAAVAKVRDTDSTIKAELIEQYNATSHGLYMTLSEDGRSFHGFIRVHMNLFRPINIVAGTRPPSIYDVLQPEQTLERTLASFYLPRDTVKALHIDNDTTVHEVISSLLKKFKIVDDPRKFALYERLTEQGESTKVKMRRMADSERPLELALSWSHHGVVNKKFVLQENDTGDILWDNFTLPELNNFLMMLNKEEEDYKRRVRQKYTEMKRRIAEQMDQLRPCGSNGAPAAGGDPRK